MGFFRDFGLALGRYGVTFDPLGEALAEHVLHLVLARSLDLA